MKAIILTILVLGLWGTVGTWGEAGIDDKSTQTFITKTVYDWEADTIIAETTFFYENYPCSTVFVVDTVWIPSDSFEPEIEILSINYGDSSWVNPKYTRLLDRIYFNEMKWDVLDALFDSVFKEMK